MLVSVGELGEEEEVMVSVAGSDSSAERETVMRVEGLW